MKILYLDWKSYCSEDMIPAFENQGCEVIRVPFSKEFGWNHPEYEMNLSEMIRAQNPDFIFSFNYFPLVSRVCQNEGIRYVSWVYDNPYVALYSCTVINSCNIIFVFDQAQYLTFQANRIPTVFYLPLAANTHRLDAMILTPALQEKYQSEISFVGSLYTEEKHRLYERLTGLSDYTSGYLRGLMDSQLLVYGANFIEESLSKPILSEMLQSYPMLPNPDGIETSAYLYADYVLNRHVTAMERERTLSALSQNYQVKLYTHDKEYQKDHIINCGPVDYYDEMPYVFKASKINLNMTLRSIKSGIPLRGFDILGSGGFLMTTYTSDFLEFFVPGEDLIIYESEKDMTEKAAYYLIHDEERQQIAANGRSKIEAYHTFDIRAAQIIAALS